MRGRDARQSKGGGPESDSGAPGIRRLSHLQCSTFDSGRIPRPELRTGQGPADEGPRPSNAESNSSEQRAERTEQREASPDSETAPSAASEQAALIRSIETTNPTFGSATSQAEVSIPKTQSRIFRLLPRPRISNFRVSDRFRGRYVRSRSTLEHASHSNDARVRHARHIQIRWGKASERWGKAGEKR